MTESLTTARDRKPTSRVRRNRTFWKRLSLEWKVPLLMTGVLASILATSLVLTYGTLARSSEDSVRERLASAARQVATTAQTSAVQRATMFSSVARDPAVRQLLAIADKSGNAATAQPIDARRQTAGFAGDSAHLVSAAQLVLARLVAPSDSMLPVELWTTDGRRVTYIASDTHTAPRVASPRLGHPVAWEGLEAITPSDSVSFGALFGKEGRAYFWVVMPVTDEGRRVGFLAQQRRLRSPPQAVQAMRELTGEAVEMYMRNERPADPDARHRAAAGTTYSATTPNLAAQAPMRRDSTAAGVFNERPGIGRTIVAEAGVPGTPWVVMLETAVGAIHARARETMLQLAVLSLVLIAGGAVVSWMLSRRITSPIMTLSTAAEAIAHGDYARRVKDADGDEIGRLAASFNTMAGEVDASHVELEQRVRDARSVAEALERANQQLQAAMAQAEEARSEAEQARADAERANRAKSDFLAVMSHELRTPLNAIGGYAQLLELEVHGPVTEPQRDALGRIVRSQAHLLHLINDVLNFARIDARQVQYAITDVPVDEALTGLETLVAPQVRARRLTLTYRPCGPHVTVGADRDKLQQIVLNLLTNAIKFTAEGGRVEVICEECEDTVKIQVHDTGVAIPPDRLQTVFDPFVQLDRARHPFVQLDRARHHPNDGIGLGLAISRDLARGMGGDVHVESTVGKGSVFVLMLARGAVPPRPAQPTNEGAAHPTR